MAPVVIPTLAPTLDKSLEFDRSCVQSTVLLIGTGSQTENELVCLPLERFLTRPLSCHYLLMDQATVILCYELSGQEALTYFRLNPMLSGPLAASKAFQLGVS